MTPEALARLHALCFDEAPRPWTEAEFVELLAQPGVTLTTDAGENRGFLLGRCAAAEAEILTLCTHPGHRKQGLALSLIHI